MKPSPGKIILILLLLAGGIQLIPINRSNPPVTAELNAPAEVMALLRPACYDCHSHETVWPWYSRVAPVSWLVASDVWEGRKHLNFSRWGEMSPAAEAKQRKEIREAVNEEEMPPWVYLLNHPEAKLSKEQRRRLTNWAAGSR